MKARWISSARVEIARPANAAAAREITRRYVEARYGAGVSKRESRELLALVRSFKPA